MQKFLRVCVPAALALLGFTAFTPPGEEQPAYASTSLKYFATNGSKRPPAQSISPPPGVYKAVPYTALVIVPKPVDGRMVVGAGGPPEFKMPHIRPELNLVPVMPRNSRSENMSPQEKNGAR